MKKESKRKSKGFISAITVIVVAVVVAFNIFFTILADSQLFYIDISQVKYKSAPSKMYTLSEKCRDLVNDDVISMIDSVNADRAARGQEPIALKVVFCADRDEIEGDSLTRYVSYTARSLAKEFPDHIQVEYVNMTKNPSVIQKYKTTSAATINNSDVIVEFGTEYLVQRINSFYLIDSTDEEPWAYNGEKRLTAMMLALTRAESPICAITNNHGETIFDGNGNVKEQYSTFVELIKGAGYDPVFLNLEKEEIPENCRMIIIFDPREDFKAYGNLGEGGVSEISKLDKYLDASNSLFYICGANAAVLPNLEEYLEEWGITVGRATDKDGNNQNLVIEDKVNCADGKGSIVIGNYFTEGLGATLTEDMRDRAYPPKVVFGNSATIVPSSTYIKWHVAASDDGSQMAYSYYSYFKNGNSRDMLDIFTSYNSASALLGDDVYKIATNNDLFRLMTITQETKNIQEDSLTTIVSSSYVIALASTDFLNNDTLNSSAYGNTDVILSALRNTSSEVVPADIDLKAIYEINMLDDAAYVANSPLTWLYCLILIPASVALLIGVVVTIRRKYK